MGAPGPETCPVPGRQRADAASAPWPGAAGGPSSRERMRREARCAKDFDTSEAPFRVGAARDDRSPSTRPGASSEKDEAHDPMDPRACVDGPEMSSGPLTDCPNDEPEADELFQVADDAAQEARERLSNAMGQRLFGFIAAAEYVEAAAAEVNDKSTVVAFLEKAFNVATSALVAVGTARIAAQALKSLISGALNATLGNVSSAVAGGGDKVSFPDFKAEQTRLLAAEHLAFSQSWRHDVVRAQLLASRYPHKEAAALVASASALLDQAYRTQYGSTLLAWLGTVDKARGGRGEHALEVHVTFEEGGTYRVTGCRLEGGTESIAKGLRRDATPNRGDSTLTLGELLRHPLGPRVRIIDQSQASFEWDPGAKQIATPNNLLMHHRVGAWGHAHVGPEVVPVVHAHRFLFEALGARNLADLGVTGE